MNPAAGLYIIAVTVLEVIQRSTEFLAQKGLDSPRLQTELLLAHLLRLPRMQLYLNFERTLTPAELDSFRVLIKRRGQREPLQYIAGSTSFCGLEIGLSREVLIPRPETELLAEHGWIFLNQLATTSQSQSLNEAAAGQASQGERGSEQPLRVLDFGTGSGCLGITLAVKCPKAQIHALDISAGALALARENAARHNVSDRIGFFQGDGFTPLPPGLRVDLIVANPPYIPSSELSALQPDVRDYEPHRALDGGPDGLDYYRRLSLESPPFLTSRGKIMLEIGDGQAEPVRSLFEEQKWIVEAIIADYTQRPRIVIAHRAGLSADGVA